MDEDEGKITDRTERVKLKEKVVTDVTITNDNYSCVDVKELKD